LPEGHKPPKEGSLFPEGEIPPKDWKPDPITADESSLHSGLIRGTIDALRGVKEAKPGQGLSIAQQDWTAPFLSKAMGVDEEKIRGDLDSVRLYTGGPGAKRDNPTTVGTNIYTKAPEELAGMLEFERAPLLVRELAHVAQRENAILKVVPFLHDSDRALAAQKVLAGPAAAVAGAIMWLNAKLHGDKDLTLRESIRSVKPLEAEADGVARTYAQVLEEEAAARKPH
jgi:hypothetical protein